MYSMNDEVWVEATDYEAQSGSWPNPGLLVSLNRLLKLAHDLSDCYESAVAQVKSIRCASIIALFEQHRKGQLELSSMLTDRIGSLGTRRVHSTRAAPDGSRSHCAPLRRGLVMEVLQGLTERHDLALRAALSSPCYQGVVPSWACDFAIGLVALSNDLQRAALIDVAKSWDANNCYHLSQEC